MRFLLPVLVQCGMGLSCAWGQVFSYDADGVLQNASFGGTNRLSYGFDLAGNVTSVRGPTQLEVWRHQNFGILDPNGAAADNASPAKDGIPNLIKYALGLTPSQPATTDDVGTFVKTQGGFEFYYQARTDDDRLSVKVERSGDLSNWTTENVSTSVLESNGSINLFKALHIGSASREFLRLNVGYRP